MQITAYSNFSKEANSTKQPSGGDNITVTLKDATSLLHPVFRVHHYDLSHNYVKWDNRFYFVDDIILNTNEEAEYHCTTDPMASFKGEIGASTQYVLRSASAYDGDVLDSFYPILSKQTELKTVSPQDPDWALNVSGGQFVIGVMGKNSSPNGGAITYYAISPTGMQAITDYLLDEQNWLSVDDISTELLKCVFNPLDYIVSCLWFPFQVATLGTETINVGWWSLSGISASKLSDSDYSRNLTFPVPKHPQSTSRGNYLNMQPYSRYYVNAGAWGVVPVDNSLLIGESSVRFQIKVDLYTGSGRLSLLSSDQLAFVSDNIAQIGVPIQLGQNTLNQGAVSGVASGIGQTAMGIATGGHGAILGGVISSISSALDMSQSNARTVGSNGTMAFNKIFALVGEFMYIADESIEKNGRPLCKPRVINTLNGFIQVLKADVNITGTPEEKSIIQGYMEGGFFYE